MVAEKKSDEFSLSKKYLGNRINTVGGINKSVAKKIAEYAFGEKLLYLVSNKEKKKFDVFVKNTVDEKTFVHFKDFFKKEFNVYRSED